MQCVYQICYPWVVAPPLPLTLGQDEESAGRDAAAKLMGNFARVVKDITNPGPTAIGGGTLTQGSLSRLPPSDTKYVQKMISAVCCRLLGKETSGPSTPEEALVWMKAAQFFSERIQAPGDCPGRKADMSTSQAQAMRKVLAQIEAASKLISNREVVVLDITNPGPTGVKGGDLTQTGLKRVDRKNQPLVDAMVRELTGRLLGKSATNPSSTQEMMVWIEAAGFFGCRVQGSWDECPGRPADMSLGAAKALRKMVGSMEAALKLMSNRERVCSDIVNPGPKNIEGKTLTQLNLKRLDSTHKATVDDMLKAVASRLLGKGVAGPLNQEEALVWLEAAAFLSARVQASAGECPGRAADMSSNGAKAFKGVLAEFEAACKLMSNLDRCVQDLTNPEPVGVMGGMLTQKYLKRVSSIHQASVDDMLRELSSRLLGMKRNAPSAAGGEAQVWADAASFFSSRIQAAEGAPAGRKADMSAEAGAAMQKVLASIANPPEKVDTACLEAAQMLMSNYERVVQDITNPGPNNIDGKRLTQTDLRRVDIKHKELVGAMVREVCCSLVGKATPKPLAPGEVQVWAEAARFLSARIQGTPAEMPGRNPDMSSEAATALRARLAQMEAAHMLMSNRERVVQDITNPGPRNIDGKALTQTELKRVDINNQASVNAMVKEVICRLLNKTPCTPTPQELSVWAEAAAFLSGRIQGTSAEMPGRKPDMSSDAAKALRSVLEQF